MQLQLLEVVLHSTYLTTASIIIRAWKTSSRFRPNTAAAISEPHKPCISDYILSMSTLARACSTAYALKTLVHASGSKIIASCIDFTGV